MRVWSVLLAAWGVALVSTLGAVFIGEVMGMTPCLLCWYQRIFMFSLALILGMAAFAEDRRGAVYALPLALSADVTVLACTRTSTSSSPGNGFSMSQNVKTSGPPYRWQTTAHMFVRSIQTASVRRLACPGEAGHAADGVASFGHQGRMHLEVVPQAMPFLPGGAHACSQQGGVQATCLMAEQLSAG